MNAGGLMHSGGATNEVYGIEGASYDGCNGWSTWQLDKIFSTARKAQDYIDKNLHSTFNRYEVIKINIE